MIRRLRRRHLRLALLLALVVPAILLAGWLARKPWPVQRIPPELVSP